MENLDTSCRRDACKDESLAIKKYIRYVRLQILHAKADMKGITTDYYNYYRELNNEITEFLNNHMVFARFIFGKIDHKLGMKIMGINERDFFRQMERQRKLFIKHLESTENRLLKEYAPNGILQINK